MFLHHFALRFFFFHNTCPGSSSSPYGTCPEAFCHSSLSWVLGLSRHVLTLDPMLRTSKPFLQTAILLKIPFSYDVSRHRRPDGSPVPLKMPTVTERNVNFYKKLFHLFV